MKQESWDARASLNWDWCLVQKTSSWPYEHLGKEHLQHKTAAINVLHSHTPNIAQTVGASKNDAKMGFPSQEQFWSIIWLKKCLHFTISSIQNHSFPRPLVPMCRVGKEWNIVHGPSIFPSCHDGSADSQVIKAGSEGPLRGPRNFVFYQIFDVVIGVYMEASQFCSSKLPYIHTSKYWNMLHRQPYKF